MPANGDLWSVIVKATLFAQEIRTCFTYRATDVPALVNDAYVADSLKTQFKTLNKVWDKLISATSANVLYYSVVVQKVWPTRSVIREYASIATGAIADNAAAANQAAVVTRRTQLAGRKQVSNLHICGIGKLDMVNGLISAPEKTLLLSFGVQSITPLAMIIGDPTFTPVIYHSKATPSGQYDELTSCIVQDQVRTERRRTVGLGI